MNESKFEFVHPREILNRRNGRMRSRKFFSFPLFGRHTHHFVPKIAVATGLITAIGVDNALQHFDLDALVPKDERSSGWNDSNPS